MHLAFLTIEVERSNNDAAKFRMKGDFACPSEYAVFYRVVCQKTIGCQIIIEGTEINKWCGRRVAELNRFKSMHEPTANIICRRFFT